MLKARLLDLKDIARAFCDVGVLAKGLRAKTNFAHIIGNWVEIENKMLRGQCRLWRKRASVNLLLSAHREKTTRCWSQSSFTLDIAKAPPPSSREAP